MKTLWLERAMSSKFLCKNVVHPG